MKDRQRIWPALVPLWMIIYFIGFAVNMVYADIEEQKPPDTLLQYRAGSHIIGFGSDAVYLVDMAGALRIDFLNPQATSPLALNEAAATSPETHSSIPTRENTLENLSRVEYQNIWSGITLRYNRAEDGITESTYFLGPGADVADIQVRYNANTEVQQDGSLKISLATQQGYISESRPIAWQVIDGKKVPIEVEYTVKEGIIGFATAEYNKTHELIIDPTYQWHSFYGSSEYDIGVGIAVDSSGNIYIAGNSYASWLGPNNSAPRHAYSGQSDIAVLKLDSSGIYQWHTFFGSPSWDNAAAIATDNNGNIYITGDSQDSWLGPNNTAPKHVHSGDTEGDITVVKLNSSGTYQWHVFFGSTAGDYGTGIAVGGNGNIYVTGYSGAGWSVTNNLNIIRLPKNPHSGDADIVVICINSSGVSTWHTFFGSSGGDFARGIAVMENEFVYVVGTSYATWQGPGNTSPVNPHAGGPNFVGLKLSISGDYQGHTFLGSGAEDYATSVAVDNNGNIYLTGYSTVSWGSPINPLTQGDIYGPYDIVVIKLDSTNQYLWHTYLGSSDDDYGVSIKVDEGGNAFVTGTSHASWGNPLSGYNGYGYGDATVLSLDKTGKLKWHGFFGSPAADGGRSIAYAGNGTIYVTGLSEENWGSPIHNHSGSNCDIMVLKLKQFHWPMFFPAITK